MKQAIDKIISQHYDRQEERIKWNKRALINSRKSSQLRELAITINSDRFPTFLHVIAFISLNLCDTFIGLHKGAERPYTQQQKTNCF